MPRTTWIACFALLMCAACSSDSDSGTPVALDAGPSDSGVDVITSDATAGTDTSTASDTTPELDGASDADSTPELDADTGSGPDTGPDADTTPEPDAGVDAEPGTPVDGVRSLYIGHSFGRKFAERTVEYAPTLGIDGHEQQIVFSGGQSGAPQNLWDNASKRSEVMAILETGDIEHMTMICCSEQFLVTGEDPAIQDWMAEALTHNPDTRFALAMPWPDFPADWPEIDEMTELWDEAHDAWMALIGELRTDHPGIEIVTIPHGRAALALRRLFDEGRLRDVDSLIGPRDASIFTDQKGHAGELLLEIGTLVWLGATYGVDVSGFPHSRDTDIARIAQLILDNYGD